MTNRSTAEFDWADCPAGKIGDFAARLKTKQRRSPRRWAPVAMLVVLTGLLVVQLTEASQMELKRFSQFGGVSCEEALARADAYIRGELNPDVRSQVGFHFSNCPRCARQVRGVAKRDLLHNLFGASEPVVREESLAARSPRRRHCDDDEVAAPRTPVVAQKVLAAVGD